MRKIKWRNVVILLITVGGVVGLATAGSLMPKEMLDRLIVQGKGLIPGGKQTRTVIFTVSPSATATLSTTAVMTVTVAAGQPIIYEGLAWFSTPTPTPSPIAGTAMVQAKSLNLRAGPGTEYQTVGAARQGDKLPVLGRNLQSTWLKVQIKDASEAWVFAQLVAVDVQLDQIPISAVPPTPTPAK